MGPSIRKPWRKPGANTFAVCPELFVSASRSCVVDDIPTQVHASTMYPSSEVDQPTMDMQDLYHQQNCTDFLRYTEA